MSTNLMNLPENLRKLIIREIKSPKIAANLSKTCKSMQKNTKGKRFELQRNKKLRNLSIQKLKKLLMPLAWNSFYPAWENAYQDMHMDPHEFFQFNVYASNILRRKLRNINVSEKTINNIVNGYTIHYNKISNTNLRNIINNISPKGPQFDKKNWNRMQRTRRMYLENKRNKNKK